MTHVTHPIFVTHLTHDPWPMTHSLLWSRLFHIFITRSVKKCWRRSLLKRFFFTLWAWPRVLLLVSNSKKTSNFTLVCPFIILNTSIKSARFTDYVDTARVFLRRPMQNDWVRLCIVFYTCWVVLGRASLVEADRSGPLIGPEGQDFYVPTFVKISQSTAEL